MVAAASVRDEGLPEKKKVNSITSSRLWAIIAFSLATLTTIYVFLTLPWAPSDLAMSREDSLVLYFSLLPKRLPALHTTSRKYSNVSARRDTFAS